jgi:hypothetical protein
MENPDRNPSSYHVVLLCFREYRTPHLFAHLPPNWIGNKLPGCRCLGRNFGAVCSPRRSYHSYSRTTTSWSPSLGKRSLLGMAFHRISPCIFNQCCYYRCHQACSTIECLSLLQNTFSAHHTDFITHLPIHGTVCCRSGDVTRLSSFPKATASIGRSPR